MYNKVELCGVDTAQLPVLSEAEKRQLLTRARAGDAAARQAMIEGNLRLVLSVVQRFAQRGENLDDLFQVGCIGLIKAIDNFDPAQPVRFSTYGVPMIIGEIRRFLRDNNALRVSRSLRDAAYKAMQARETLEKQLGREPTVDEVARQAGLSRREVNAALESVVEPISLEEPLYTDGGDAMYVIDQVRDPDSEDSWISGLEFRQTVAGLTPREKRIMELRYLKGETQMEVAREIGMQPGAGLPAGKGRAGAVPAQINRRAAQASLHRSPTFCICVWSPPRPADGARPCCGPVRPAPGQTGQHPRPAGGWKRPCAPLICCTRTPGRLPAPWHCALQCTLPAAPPAAPAPRSSGHASPVCGLPKKYEPSAANMPAGA